MPHHPVASGEKRIIFVNKLGYSFHHQVGSHVKVIKVHNDTLYSLSIPLDREIAVGTLHALVKKIAKSEDTTTDQIYELLSSHKR